MHVKCVFTCENVLGSNLWIIEESCILYYIHCLYIHFIGTGKRSPNLRLILVILSSPTYHCYATILRGNEPTTEYNICLAPKMHRNQCVICLNISTRNRSKMPVTWCRRLTSSFQAHLFISYSASVGRTTNGAIVWCARLYCWITDTWHD